MYTIIAVDELTVEEQVRQVVSERLRAGRRLPEFLLSPELVGQPPRYVDGFLVMGSRCVFPGQLCVVSRLSERPSVRHEG